MTVAEERDEYRDIDRNEREKNRRGERVSQTHGKRERGTEHTERDRGTCSWVMGWTFDMGLE